jgi:glyoxylase-like metal-dependent hydrolase (beta-lactamase superfamily II)
MSTFFQTLRPGRASAFCYIFPAGDTVIVVDPGGTDRSLVTTILSLSPRSNTVQILLTHSHVDHFLGADMLLSRFSGSSLYVSAADEAGLYTPAINASSLYNMRVRLDNRDAVKHVADGQVLQFGKYKIEVIATPGHTPGGVIYLLRDQKVVFTGDTIFQGKMGRTDLPGADEALLRQSIKEKICTLPDDFQILGGHRGPTTVGRERRQFG